MKKPIGRFWLFLFQILEPWQLVFLGGSQMAYLRMTARLEHRIGHIRAQLDRLGGPY